MKKEIMSNYEAPVTEVIVVEITPIMENTNPGGGGSGSGNDDNPED